MGGRTRRPSPLPSSAAAELPKWKKKKGRPSLLEIQKRLVKQQKSQSYQSDQKNPNPSNPIRNPNRRSPSSKGPYPSSNDDEERLSKKHRLLQGIDGEDPNSLTLNGREDEKCPKGTDEKYVTGSAVELGPTTPLPDKTLLAFILDRLQNKDSYGVFSEQFDPKRHPMDFGNVMKMLDDGEYSNLERFERMVLNATQRFMSGNNLSATHTCSRWSSSIEERDLKSTIGAWKDIFLICSNAMEYNAPDTIFFRQAHTMQDLARKDFENLRQDSDSEPQQPKVVRRGRRPGSVQRKSLEKYPLYRIGYEGLSDANLANEVSVPWSNMYNLRRELPVKNFGPFESNGLISHRTPNSESHSSWFTEMDNEFPGSVWRNVMKNGKRLTYAAEHRRETYSQQPLSRSEESPSSVFDKETKQLVMEVGLQFEHGYTRSLARFTVNLGPFASKTASRKIQSVLPPGVGFGPGWVGENENVVKPPQVDTQKCSISRLPSNVRRRCGNNARTEIWERCNITW